MRLFEESSPWTEADWWQAGHNDAMNCVAARYDGSDASEDVLRAYIGGYSIGTSLMKRTAVCDRLTPSVSFDWPETRNLIPGIFPESAAGPIKALILSTFAILLWWIVISWVW